MNDQRVAETRDAWIGLALAGHLISSCDKAPGLEVASSTEEIGELPVRVSVWVADKAPLRSRVIVRQDAG